VVEDRPVDGRCDLNAGSNHIGAPLIGTPVPISLGHVSLESCRAERCELPRRNPWWKRVPRGVSDAVVLMVM